MNKRVHLITKPVCGSCNLARELAYAYQKVENEFGNDYCRITARRVRTSKDLARGAWYNYAFSGEPKE